MPENRIDCAKFRKLSAVLLGVTENQLSPGVDAVKIANQYCLTLEAMLNQQQVADVNEMADKAATMPVSDLLADAKFGPLGRSIMKLWLLGGWYDPQVPQQMVKVISSQAYKESLVWRAMQSHPMGYSMLPFEHWSKAPQPLEVFFSFANPKGA